MILNGNPAGSWGNPRTISWEPHLELTLASGQEANWAVEYEFGGGMKM